MEQPMEQQPSSQMEQQPTMSEAGAQTAPSLVDDLLDPVLMAGLRDARNRALVLKIESSVDQFLKSGRARLEFPPLVSYQRLIVHRVAEYYALAHTVMTSDAPDNGKRVVALARTPDTRVPSVRLKDAIAPPSGADGAGAVSGKVKIAKPGGNFKQARTTNLDLPSVPLEQREDAYAAARARIMGLEPVDEPATAPVAARKPDEPAAADPSANPWNKPPTNVIQPAVPNPWTHQPEQPQPAVVRQSARPEFDPDYCRNIWRTPGPAVWEPQTNAGHWQQEEQQSRRPQHQQQQQQQQQQQEPWGQAAVGMWNTHPMWGPAQPQVSLA